MATLQREREASWRAVVVREISEEAQSRHLRLARWRSRPVRQEPAHTHPIHNHHQSINTRTEIDLLVNLY
jgi:hypothetical protein